MNVRPDPPSVARRSFLAQGAYGFGGLALAMLEARDGRAATPAGGFVKPDDRRPGTIGRPPGG